MNKRLLIILRSVENIRRQYFEGIAQAFPALHVDMVSDPAAAGPYLPGADIILTHGPHLGRYADTVFGAATKLRWVQGIGTGVDNIADRPSLPPEVIVSCVHGVHGPAMAEAAMASMLALSRQVPRSVENKGMRRWENWPSRLLNGRHVGILGIGSIAEAMGPRFKAFNMKVTGISSGVRNVAGFDAVCPKTEMMNLIPELDYFIVLTPYSPETHNLVNREVIFAMKPSSFLINVARGGVLDEAALIEALSQKRIAGAALDVFKEEPLKPESLLWGVENLIITCHQAATHEDSAKNNLPTIIHNIRHFLAGDRSSMRNVVAR